MVIFGLAQGVWNNKTDVNIIHKFKNIKGDIFIILNKGFLILHICLTSLSFVRPILNGEHKPDIISKGAKYELPLTPFLYSILCVICKQIYNTVLI